MKLLGSTENRITEDKSGENVPHLEIMEVLLYHYNIVNNGYLQGSRVLYTFIPDKTSGNLLKISPTKYILLETFNSEYDENKVWFTDQNSKPLEMEDRINLTMATNNSATIIDHILASYPEGVTQQGIIHVGLCDYQLIFCARKICRIKEGKHKNIKFHLFKHNSADLFKEILTSTNVLNYQNFNDATEAYDNFIQKIMIATDKVAPIKEKRIKHNST